jgi:uncharacterized membrane protein
VSERAQAAPSPRVSAIDVLRGFVMVLMSIDHASEVFNRGRLFTDAVWVYTPGTPLPAAQFFTRWMTHLCAPTFVALAGTALAISAERRRARGETASSIDRHIFLRGALLIGFEVVWMSFAMREKVGLFLLQVLYAIGGSLICMALLRRLGDRALLALGLALALGTELLVGLAAATGVLETLPVALTVSGGFFFGGRLIVAYPVLPWLGVMCVGWAFGRRLVAWRAAGLDETARGAKVLAIAGVTGLALFGALRTANGFGNMRLLRDAPGVVQWLHVSKYPPSATFVGLELGIAALLLSALMRLGSRAALEPLRLLGQTALFYYLLHVHALALFAQLTGLHGQLGIRSAYLGALAVLVVLYPACAWYRRYKAAHPAGFARWI